MDYPIELHSNISFEDFKKCQFILRGDTRVLYGLLIGLLLLWPIASGIDRDRVFVCSYLFVLASVMILPGEWKIRQRSFYANQLRLLTEGQSFAFYPTYFTVTCQRDGYITNTSMEYRHIYSATIAEGFIILFHSPKSYSYLISLANLSQPQREDLKALLRQNIRKTVVTSQ